jgi:hypothetical protein
MFNRKVIAVLGLVLAISAPAAFGSPLPADADADGVLNNVEYWMQRNGATVDNNGDPILATPPPGQPITQNSYLDSDGDGIPDLVEIYFTLTDPTVDDRAACAGGGSPDMTGQYEVRRAASLGAGVNFLTDELSAISVCHTSGGVKVFSPRMGYATSADFNSSILSATWSYRGVTVTFSGTCTTCGDTNVVLTGSLTIGAVSSPASATRRATSTASAAVVNGLYAVQEAHYPAQPGASADKLEDLGSRALQIAVNAPTLSEALVYTKDTYEAYPAYYSALTGTVFYTSFIYYDDAHKNLDSLSNTDSRRIALMVTEPPAGGVGGRIRGSGTELYDYLGTQSVIEKQLYGKASLPDTGGVTLNRTVGVGTLLYLNNVPVSADAATVSGPGIATSTIWSDLDTDYFNDRSFKVSYGFRLPGFTDGERVGLATDGTSLDVSSIYRLFQSPLANNTYAFNFSGAVGGFGAVNVPHTDRSSTPLPVVTNVQLDGSPLTAGRQKSLTGEDLSVDRVLSWSRVTTGGINGNGAGLYRVIITDPFHGVIYPPASITDPSPDTLSFFVDPSDLSNPCPSDCSVTIKGGTLDSSTAYRIEIEARDKDDPNNRSLTNRYYLNTKPYVAGDFNLDHTNDILWRRISTGSTVQWLMHGATYTVTGLSGDSDWSVIGTGDFDDDGRADILWRRTSTGSTVLWLMSGSGRKATAALNGDSDWTVAQIGDFNGDGKSDILWRRTSTGSVVLWLMDGLAPGATIALGGNNTWTITHVGDFNGDGKSDILWRSSTGSTVMWLMDGATHTATGLSGDGDWSVIHIGDFDGDGKSDILWRRASTGSVVLWLMTGAGAAHTAVPLGGNTDWNITHVGDFNGDGISDLLWRRVSTGSTVMWLMDGTTHTATGLSGDGDWSVIHVGDYDSDGKSDILWRRTSNGQVVQWLMTGAGAAHTSAALGGDSSDWMIMQ